MPTATASRTVVAMTIVERLRRPWVLDGLLALGAIVAMALITAKIEPGDGERSLDAIGYMVIGGAAAMLALRHAAPVVGLAVVTVLLWVYTARDYAGGPIYLTFFVMVFAVAVSMERRRSLVITAVALAALVVPHLVAFGLDDGAWPYLSVGWTAAAWFWGDGLRTRRAYLAGLEERARYLEETREEEARRRVADERLRIARDVHDVIAHSIASINVQAGSAVHVMDRRPEQARDALLAIKAASSEALAELRSTIGPLRADEHDPPRAPTPTLARLDPLLEMAARAGIPVEVAVRGEPHPLPSAVDVACYRIVQESLTNVVRHAHAHEATITLEYRPSFVELEVTDDGQNGAARGDGEPGHGIAGMRERAEAVGGRVEAGPRFAGGFRVWARLPINSETG
jgi:signal transduction histidine kinase